MNSIPTLYRNREISFDPNMIEKMKYLSFKAGIEGMQVKHYYSQIVNAALKEFFEVKFKELKLEHYINQEYEDNIRKAEEQRKKDMIARDDQRLLQLAKLRIINREIEKIQEEEKKSGKKIEPPEDIKRRLFNYKI